MRATPNREPMTPDELAAIRERAAATMTTRSSSGWALLYREDTRRLLDHVAALEAELAQVWEAYDTRCTAHMNQVSRAESAEAEQYALAERCTQLEAALRETWEPGEYVELGVGHEYFCGSCGMYEGYGHAENCWWGRVGALLVGSQEKNDE